MAKMHPASPPQGIPDSERQVWHALSKLSDEWSVFHGVDWQGNRGGRQREGEADFVLLHTEVGLLFLEVKGGREFRIIDGQWYRQSGAELSRIADPFEQVRSSQHEIVRRVREGVNIAGFGFGHAVVFPHLATVEGLGLAASDATVLTRSDSAMCLGP